MLGFPALALSGCLGAGDGGSREALLHRHATPVEEFASPSSELGLGAEQTSVVPKLPEDGDGARSGLIDGRPVDGDERESVDSGDSGEGGVSGDSTATTPGSRRLARIPRNNPEADDLLDHWGRRPLSSILATLSLTAPAAEDSAEGLRTLRTTVATDEGTSVAPDLADNDDVRILGSRHGITYGRWIGGPADTLSILFTLSPAMQEKSGFRAMVRRAGKAWSHRIVDTWSTWEREPGAFKGWLINGTEPDIEVRVGEGGEVSTGLEIDIRDEDLPADTAGWAKEGTRRPGASWEPRFGSLDIDRTHLAGAAEKDLFTTLAHEIGHVLGAWKGGTDTAGYADHTDTAAGTWTGPNVVAVYGAPAPFQDDADPKAWVDGKRNPTASRYDFSHSGVCVSLMSYCRSEAALPAFTPHAIDFAFLADLGLTIAEETDRPETYGLAGWTDQAAFTLSVSRDLRVAVADPQPYYDGAANDPWTLEVRDLLNVGVDVFGQRSVGDIGESYETTGTVRYAGGLIGAAVDRAALPPVTGHATLVLDLGTLDGRASFTSLAVHTAGTRDVFAGGRLYYPFEFSGNALTGTSATSILHADFFGPLHEDVAGVLHDPVAGLLASFGATEDDRPSREAVVTSADYLAGLAHRRGSADAADDGWYGYRCDGDAACESRHSTSTEWGDWTEISRDGVLAATAGWDSRDSARPDSDRGFLRMERQSSAATDGARGRHVRDAYVGTLEHSAFASGFEKYTDEWAGADGTAAGFHRAWTGVQGDLSGSIPDTVARWSGVMVGYDRRHAAGEAAFVEGLATAAFWLSRNRVSLEFSEVGSRDGLRQLDAFGFTDLQLDSDGAFRGGGTTGIVNGGFFGASHEEAAGAFHHNAAKVTGSFGAQRMADTVTLRESGATRDLGTFFAFDDWGLWGEQFGEALFGAFLAQTVRQEGTVNYYSFPAGRLEGSVSGANPVSGSAVWSGKVRAVDGSGTTWTPVSGDARLEVDFGGATVDVDFTNLGTGYGDMSWSGLRIVNGAFRHTLGNANLSGAFYGTQHQGAAGTFRRSDLTGVFGAVRQTGE
ncbi:MAG: hypothetical protein OXF11_16760 [Deltaproteobacteria bacterium]|nr:hypothetical protein [Deltaproteobacteria bacterium]